MMKKAPTIPLVVFLTLALSATIGLRAAEASSPPGPRLDDNRGGGTLSLVTDVCSSLLGPFKEPLHVLDVDVCPELSGRVLRNPHIHNVFASGDWNGSHPAGFSRAAINDLTRKIID